MNTGTVNWFNDFRGFGFVTPDDHWSERPGALCYCLDMWLDLDMIVRVYLSNLKFAMCALAGFEC